MGIDPSEVQHYDSNHEPEDMQQTNTSTHRFWWNKLVFNGASSFNDNVYLLTNSEVNMTFYGSSKGTTGSRGYENNSTTTWLNVSVINYAPVYPLLNGANSPAWSLYSEATGSNSWKYTDESVAKAKLAAYYLVKCNPNNYDFANSANAAICANDIKLAYDFFNKVSLVKKTATVHITQGEGTVLNVSNNGTTLVDGATVTYGDTLSASAVAETNYNQSSPVITITGGSVTGNSTLVNEPDIYISTADLPLNTYTVTFNYGDDQTSTVTKTHGTRLTTAEIPTNTAKSTTVSTVYTFTGWNGDTAAPITGNTVFTAQYSETPRKYSVTVTPGTGTTITGVSTGEYDYNTEITVTAVAQDGFHA